jgi:hypothetical protein
MRLQFGSVLVASIVDDILNGRDARSEWIIALVIYHGAFTIALSSFDWNLRMIAMLDLDAQPYN